MPWYPGGIAFFSLYLFTGPQAKENNKHLLGASSNFLAQLSTPWICGLDANMNPEDFKNWGWLQQHAATIVAPSCPTFLKADGSRLDWFIVSQGLDHFIESVGVLLRAPVGTHVPSVLQLRCFDGNLKISAAISWKSFPIRHPIGARRPPRSRVNPKQQWNWEAGHMPQSLQEAVEQWHTAVEADLAELHDKIGEKGYHGRAQGFKLRQVPIWEEIRRFEPSISTPRCNILKGTVQALRAALVAVRKRAAYLRVAASNSVQQIEREAGQYIALPLQA